jgi:hypothetical protein
VTYQYKGIEDCGNCGTACELEYVALTWSERKRLLFVILFGVPSFIAMVYGWQGVDFVLAFIYGAVGILVAATGVAWAHFSEVQRDAVKITPKALPKKSAA